MFDTLGIEAIIITVRKGSDKFQVAFFKNTQTLWISNRLVKIVPFNYYRSKKTVFEEIVFEMKKRYISKRSFVMRGGLKRY